MYQFEKILIQKKLSDDLKECHKAAMRFIENVTNSAQLQSESEGIELDPHTITPEIIVSYAAKRIGFEYNELLQNYVDLMVLEKMIEYVPNQ